MSFLSTLGRCYMKGALFVTPFTVSGGLGYGVYRGIKEPCKDLNCIALNVGTRVLFYGGIGFYMGIFWPATIIGYGSGLLLKIRDEKDF